MKAIILLATLKKEGLSNTEVLCEFLVEFLQKNNIDSEIVKLVNHNILPGTFTNMGQNDDWPKIFDKIKTSEIIIFASPIWWNHHSSELQKVIERLDEVHDEILAGKKSVLEGKVGGVVVTGDSDGAQSIIANVANFFSAIGIALPPMSTLTVIDELQAKSNQPTREELWKKYQKDYTETAQKMAINLKKFAKQKSSQ
ncbi:flavodoxin family protein [Flavobacterium sp. NST-5]|uniref:Flavodoxin family protein n=1 Tax=Flavobacterium ichthyis TaxID=2698827 RepID=A0ABW9Z5Q1_9FLAO|nr:NAD(P)H-dependent oxidoreductase [Flavobacterium ichthyis]NBL64172.1 flavodoxin family protein [Flavobacterium ichthyis]